MSKFEHLKKLEVQGTKTVEFPMVDVGGAILHVLPATESNKPFWNATLRNLNKKKSFSKKKVTAGLIEQNRKDDRELYPLYIVKGWDNMKSPDGEAILYTGEDCVDLINQLPDHMFDELRDFCADPSNFVEYDIDPEEVAGN